MDEKRAERLRAVIEGRRFAPAMKRALRRVVDGESYRNAAKAEGIESSYREVWRNAGTVPGLREAHLEAWRQRWGESFPALWRQHLEHQEPDPAAG